MIEPVNGLLGRSDANTSPNHRADQLLYLSDLLLELRDLADAQDCQTLAGLLLLSHAEALRQARTSR